MMNTFDELSHLVETLERDVQSAKHLISMNQADDGAVKIAIVGFAYHSTFDDWTISDFDFVRGRIDSELPDEELNEYGQNAENVRLYYCLCIGYLLGLYRVGRLDDLSFRRAEAQIPGLIMFHLER